METRFRGVDSGRVLSASAIAHGANYGMDVGFEDGTLVIDGERFERLVPGDGDESDEADCG